MHDAAEALNALESLLSVPPARGDDVTRERVDLAAVAAARTIAALPRSLLTPAVIERALSVSATLRGSRIFGTRSMPDAPEIYGRSQGAGAVIARMLLTPAWRSPLTPLLNQVPDVLWGEYAAWLFAAPQVFLGDGDADRYCDHVLRHLEELARWVERNLGSPAVRAAMQSYLSAIRPLTLSVTSSSLKRHAELHGRILAAAGGSRRAPLLKTRARVDRKLRVAFVGSHPAALPDIYRTLDSIRFEVSAHVLEGAAAESEGTDVAISAILSLLHSGNRNQKCRQLPPTLVAQMNELGELGADVIVYCEDLALSTSALSQLAAQRLAPLQIAIAPVSITTGLASIDLLVAGESAVGAKLTDQFCERLALVPGSGHLFQEPSEAPVPAPAAARAALALPVEACVLMTAARLVEITPAKMNLWAEILQRIPSAVLVIQLLQAETVPAGAIEALGADWDARLQAAGVPAERGLILAAPIGSIAELQSVVAAADLYLDACTFGEPDLAHVPLALGVPVVAREGAALRSSLTAGLLRSLGLDAGVARNEAEFIALVGRLAAGSAERHEMATRQRAALAGNPLCRDQLAAAEMLGFVLAEAYDDLHALGTRKFRVARPIVLSAGGPVDGAETLRLGGEALAAGDPVAALRNAHAVLRAAPAHGPARWLAGRAYLAGDEFAHAVEYLLAAVQTLDDGAVWFDLAVALQRNQQPKEALQALETSLRHDGSRADSWVMLIDLAKAVGATEVVQEALAALRTCAPHDPRIAALEASLRTPAGLAN